MTALPPFTNFQALTVTSNSGRLARIVTDIGVSVAFDPHTSTGPAPEIHRTTAIWDTGASRSVITNETARALCLVPSSMARMSHAGGMDDVNGYLVNFYLPNGLNILGAEALEMKNSLDCGVLIGMDIITLGDFAITNVGGVTKVSFRYPSIAEVDFVVESNRINSAVKRDAGIGRNEPCPCGSGKKYKNCHGR